MNETMEYIVIVPAKNEEARLSCALESIVTQTILPKLCLVIDDGSTDDTPQIIAEFESRFDWIRHVRTEHQGKDSWGLSKEDAPHFAEIVQRGITSARSICETASLRYEYIAKVDADFILSKEYFEEVFRKFDDEPELGIASGDVYYIETPKQIGNSQDYEHQKILDDTPSDGARLYRKTCLDDIGGIPMVGSPDGAALAIARNLGWRTRRLKDIKIFTTRKSVGGGSAWRGHVLAGQNAYALDYHPFLMLLNAIAMFISSPHYQCFAWIWGYVRAAVRRTPKVNDQRIRLYFRKQRLRELTKSEFETIKNFFTKRS